MMKSIKSRSNRIIVKCILGIIILSLILSTMNGFFYKDLENYAAQVNGENISLKTLQNMYLIERLNQKKMLGTNFSKIENNQQIKQETYNYVLSQLINNVLLEQYAKKMKFQIEDETIKKTILNASIFQKNKKFDEKKYLQYLSSMNLRDDEYINIIKRKVNADNFIHTISNTDFILENEKKYIIKLLSQKRKIRTTVLNSNLFINKQNISYQEAFNYFQKNKNLFYIPEKFKMSYVRLTPKIFKIKCNEKEIQNWYIKHNKRYFTEEKRKYGIIQIKDKNEASLLLSQINTPEDFSRIAKTKSIDPISSKKGGDIGWMSIHSIPNEIQQAHLCKKNQISNVIPFNNEFLIIKLIDIIPSQKKNLSKVYQTIKNEIKNKKSLDLYHKLKNKIKEITKNNPDKLDIIIQKINLKPIKTDWFDKNSIPISLNTPILKSKIFKTLLIQKEKKNKSYSNLIVLKKHQSFLINLTKYQKKQIKKFENVKDEIIKKIKKIKAIEETNKNAKKIVLDLKKGNKNLLKKFNLFFNKSEIISRYDNNDISEFIFSLPHPNKKQKIYDTFQDENKNSVIVAFERIYYDDFSDEEKNIIVKYLEKNNKETTFYSILKNLYQKSKVIYKK
ncbi:peptidylprolyl isomerase [Buchnera aphidicola (Muscaphis stroyani)]|uniref:Periplasmic chaperone PpiD n=2 Tax=Buchnera aphidicola TaxID=9 RepID=A0A4D6Y4N9_9GAMM|nr:peptidylprolyl isomerase [Buchnera aphidicola (Muscaphis stroyani)]